MTKEQIEHIFTYHPPKSDQPERYEQIREGAKAYALLLLDLIPQSPPELDIAMLHLEECVMFANAAIARNE